jgi:hypothetical protein
MQVGENGTQIEEPNHVSNCCRTVPMSPFVEPPQKVETKITFFLARPLSLSTPAAILPLCARGGTAGARAEQIQKREYVQ